jgi:SPP1 family predicted phage head-tail adaptor
MQVKLLDPGDLGTELILEQAALAPDGAGGHAETWSEVATVFAHVEPVAAKEAFGAAQESSRVTHRVTIRQRGDIASAMRFRRGQRIFEILTVHDPDETGRYLVCRTREAGR